MAEATAASTSKWTSSPHETSKVNGEAENHKKREGENVKAKKKKDVVVDPEVVRRRREEKALARQKAAEAEEKAKANGEIPPERLRFRKREMIDVPVDSASVGEAAERPCEASGGPNDAAMTITVMTWNLLAQALVRRTLFPGSDLLKWKDRGDIITQEFLHYNPTVACLQEVDKLEHYEPIFRKAGYDLTWQRGYTAKLHGLCIAWKADRFEKVAEKVIKLDNATFDAPSSAPEPAATEAASGRPRTGCSRVTRNLGLFVALRSTQSTSSALAKGIVLVTQHLFWHARHQYERTRQVAVLLREIDSFRREENGRYSDWPCFFAGDFNIQPSEGTYRLMTGADLSEAQIDAFNLSSVVHKTLDEYHARQQEASGEEEVGDDDADEDDDDTGKQANGKEPVSTGEVYAQPEGDEDRVLKNTRPARESDGLLSLDEIRAVYNKYRHNMWSIYGQYYGLLDSEKGNVFGERNAPATQRTSFDDTARARHVREGYFEPAWTNITPLWRCTLDYIFYMPPLASADDRSQTQDASLKVKRLLPTHRLEDMEPGLPRSDKEPSDHISLMAEVEI